MKIVLHISTVAGAQVSYNANKCIKYLQFHQISTVLWHHAILIFVYLLLYGHFYCCAIIVCIFTSIFNGACFNLFSALFWCKELYKHVVLLLLLKRIDLFEKSSFIFICKCLGKVINFFRFTKLILWLTLWQCLFKTHAQ